MSSEEECSQSREKFTAERSSSDSPKPPEEDSFFGPALPPHLLGKKDEPQEKVYGPIMPSYLSVKEEEISNAGPEKEDKEGNMIGPEIPKHLNSEQPERKREEGSSEDEDFGPSPALMVTENSPSNYNLIGHRKMKSQEAEDSSSKRESWMLELPEKKAPSLGLCSRQFRTRVPTDKESDRSVWTDTPADKLKKEKQGKEKDHKEELKMKRLQERDKAMEKLARKAAKKLRKEESLLEMHMKKMKKKKKKEAKELEEKGKTVPERRPFDRNVDLQVHRFDESQKRAILNKSRFLNDRFAAGESKFL